MSRKIRVVVADDIESIRAKYCAALSRNDSIEIVAQAATGYQAIMACALHKPDVVLMDIEMESNTAGIDATRAILAELPDTKIVAITVYNEDAYIFRAFQAGMCDYILKDSSTAEIVRCITDAYHGLSPIRPQIAGRIREEFARIKSFEADATYNMYLMKLFTDTEIDILELFYQGKDKATICKERFIEMQTLKTHIHNIKKKLEKPSIGDVLSVLEASRFFESMKCIKDRLRDIKGADE